MVRSKSGKKSSNATVPDFFYKYSPIDSIPLILNGGNIKVTDPTSFNDPFDCNIPLMDLGKINLLKMLKDEFGARLGLSNNPKFNQQMNTFRSEIDEMAEVVLRQTSDVARNWDVLLSQFRVLSLTTKPDNILMWSHYAENHTGAVLKFSAKAPPFKKALKVKYGGGEKLMSMFLTAATTELARHISRDRPESELDKLASEMSDKNCEMLFRYLLIKREEWVYEQEYRVILSVDNPELTRKTGLDTVYFAPGDLSEIIFGVNCPPEKMQNIKALVHSGYPGVKITKAKKRGLDLILPDEDQA
ncbi:MULTISPECIES: DUF2971 domain-containing protein [Pseudomonas]|uniref:DUF2971 domain-containing protein n=1 Tax=Pseudomonas capeferrum TaxID=1495066 RepID=A0ABY7R3E3_9PSED|nr:MULTISPECIES: DUF2971 domain-containing protein [Pseudomonas]WCH98050.1 DUF2971 domain-containing protein [Pseudomonas capeferrum]